MDLIIRQLDKGSSIIVLDAEIYCRENLAMLSDSCTYMVLHTYPTTAFKSTLKSLVDYGVSLELIMLKEADYMIPQYPIMSIFH